MKNAKNEIYFNGLEQKTIAKMLNDAMVTAGVDEAQARIMIFCMVKAFTDLNASDHSTASFTRQFPQIDIEAPPEEIINARRNTGKSKKLTITAREIWRLIRADIERKHPFSKVTGAKGTISEEMSLTIAYK